MYLFCLKDLLFVLKSPQVVFKVYDFMSLPDGLRYMRYTSELLFPFNFIWKNSQNITSSLIRTAMATKYGPGWKNSSIPARAQQTPPSGNKSKYKGKLGKKYIIQLPIVLLSTYLLNLFFHLELCLILLNS